MNEAVTDNLVNKVFSNDSDIELLKLSTPLMRLWNNYKEFKSK